MFPAEVIKTCFEQLLMYNKQNEIISNFSIKTNVQEKKKVYVTFVPPKIIHKSVLVWDTLAFSVWLQILFQTQKQRILKPGFLMY